MVIIICNECKHGLEWSWSNGTDGLNTCHAKVGDKECGHENCTPVEYPTSGPELLNNPDVPVHRQHKFRADYLEQLTQVISGAKAPAITFDGVGGTFTLHKLAIPELAEEYVSNMETERTNDWCKCEWLVHPEDEGIDPTVCSACGHPRALHKGLPDEPMACTKRIERGKYSETPSATCVCEDWVDPPKRRLRRGETHPECPIHTKEGFLLGFFEWLAKRD